MAPLINTNDLHRIFQQLDKNGDGLLSVEELNWLLDIIGTQLSLDELETSIGKSCLSLEEFLLFCDEFITRRQKRGDDDWSSTPEVQEEEDEEEERDLVRAFNVFDLNGDGFISCEEVQAVLSRMGLWDENSGKDCRTMICKYDTNFDGVLDFQEFKNMMLHTGS